MYAFYFDLRHGQHFAYYSVILQVLVLFSPVPYDMLSGDAPALLSNVLSVDLVILHALAKSNGVIGNYIVRFIGYGAWHAEASSVPPACIVDQISRPLLLCTCGLSLLVLPLNYQASIVPGKSRDRDGALTA